MSEQTLDTLVFKIEKMLLVAECLADYAGGEEFYSQGFYALLDEINGLKTIYTELESTLKDMC